MALESATWVNQLVSANPVTNTDLVQQGAAHLRLIKSTLLTTFPNAGHQFNLPTVVTKSANYSPNTTTDEGTFFLVNATSGGVTISLPAVSTLWNGYRIGIMKTDGTANSVLVAPNGTDTINGVNVTFQLNADNDFMWLIADGVSAWTILSSQIFGAIPLIDGATVALNAILGRHFRLTTTTNPTISAPTNPSDGQRIIIEIIASGGARSPGLSTAAGGFRYGSDIVTIPSVASGTALEIGCVYNSTTNNWRVVGTANGY